MTVLSINSMDPNCSEMIFRSGYPKTGSYRVIKILRKQDIRKKKEFLHFPILFYF